jgi:hypothetical protein
MKINILLAVLFIVLIVQSIFFICDSRKNKDSLSAIKRCETLSINYESLKYNLELGNRLNCTYLGEDLRFLTREEKNLSVRHVLSDSVSHILYIPPAFCPSCNERVLKILPDIIETLGTRLKIVCSPADANSVINYSKQKVSFKTLLMTKDTIFEMNDSDKNKIGGKPYILNVTPAGQIKSIFIINENDIGLLIEYIESCVIN